MKVNVYLSDKEIELCLVKEAMSRLSNLSSKMEYKYKLDLGFKKDKDANTLQEMCATITIFTEESNKLECPNLNQS